MAEHIGKAVSIECYDGGVFQGVLVSVKPYEVTLKNVFKNGRPSEHKTVVILAAEIKSLNFVEISLCLKNVESYSKIESSDDDSNKKPAQKMKPAKVVRAKTVAQVEAPSDVQPRRRRSNSFTEPSSAHHYGDTSSPRRFDQPPKYHRQRSQHGAAAQSDCFNVSVESCKGDFDFEKNLAMFNKKKVFNEIDGNLSRITPKKDKFDHNEMILKTSKPVQRIQVIEGNVGQTGALYTTDDGFVIPCIPYTKRQQLFDKADSLGYTEQRRVDMVGRNTSDMVFQLIGGSNRLNPQNTHQRPTVLVMCGYHLQGSYGVNCARHLANHNIKVILYTAPSTATSPSFQQELALYELCGCQLITQTQDLPTGAIDLIINCLDSHNSPTQISQSWYKYIINWCKTSRAHVLAIDPLPGGCTIETKWSVHIGLPLQLTKSAGQTYLCEISLPKQLYSQIGINYRSPFGIKFCIPLHNE